MDDGAWRDLHAELDEAVAAAYGWRRAVAHDTDETNRRLLELNRQIAAGECEYHPFGSGADPSTSSSGGARRQAEACRRAAG